MAEAGRAIVPFQGDYSQLMPGLVSALAPAKLGKMGKAGGLAIGGALVAGIAAAGVTKALYDLGAEFDEAFDKIRVGTGKTGKPLKKLERDFKAVFASVPTDVDNASTAITELNQRLDQTGKPLQKVARNMLELSRMTGTDLSGNIQSITRLFGDWSIAADKQVPTMNKLWRAHQKTGVGIKDLSDLMVQFGSPLRNLGFEFDQAAAMFSKFEKEGVNIQTAMPGLRMALKNFAADGKEPQKALMATFKAIDQAGSSAKANTIAFETFGTRAGPDLAAAVREGRFEFDDIIASMTKGKDTIGKSSEQTRDFSENMTILGNKLKVVFEPLGTLVYKSVGQISAALADLPIRKTVRDIRHFTRTNQDFKDVLKAVGKTLVVLGKIAKIVFEGMKETWKGAWTYLKGSMQVMRGYVKVVAGAIKGDWGKAWDGIKDIFKGSLKVLVGLLRAMSGPFRVAAKKARNVLMDVFSGAWDRIESIFEAGANSVIDVINAIITAINLIPGVPDIGKVGKVGGDLSIPGTGYGRHQSGSLITGGKPSGDSVPILAERGEYVLNRNAVKEVGVANLDDLNYRRASRFQSGGPVGMIGGGIADAVSGAAGAVADAASQALHPVDWFLNKLPDPNIPPPFTGVGPYAIDAATDYIKDKVGDLFAAQAASSGSFNYTGPPADMRKLGDNAWVDTHTLAVGDYLANRFNTYITDGWRPQDASYGATNSSHKRGTPDNPGALDFAAATTEFQSFVGSHVAGVTENLLNDSYSTGPHNHVAFFRRGGIVRALRRMKRGGFTGNINKTYAEHNSANGDWGGATLPRFVIAALAEAAGMPGVTMEQMTRGESAGRPGATGVDPGGTKGFGLWMITNGYNDELIRKYGGESKMLNPVRNAAAAAEILKGSGLGAWYGDGAVTSPNAHYTGGYDIRNALGGLSYREALSGKSAKLEGEAFGGKGNASFGTTIGDPSKKRIARRRKGILAGIRRKGLSYLFKGKLSGVDGILEGLDERLAIAETMASSETGPGGSEMTDAEKLTQVSLNESILRNQGKKKNWLVKAIAGLYAKETSLRDQMFAARPAGSATHWKYGALRAAASATRRGINTLTGDMTDLTGVTGSGGEMFNTQMRLRELGASTTLEGGIAATRDSELLSLMREQLGLANRNNAILSAQLPIFKQFMPKYHGGGVIPGGGEQPIMAMGGEGVFTRDQMSAMGGGSPTVVIEIAEGAGVDPAMIDARINGQLVKAVRKTRTGGPTAGRSYVTNG